MSASFNPDESPGESSIKNDITGGKGERTFALKNLRVAMLLFVVLVCFTSSSSAQSGKSKSSTDFEERGVAVEVPRIFTELQPKLFTGVELTERLPMTFVNTKTNLVLKEDSGEYQQFYKALPVDWHDRDAMKLKFGWSTNEENVAYAIWQVSRFRYFPQSKSCLDPLGLVASGSVIPIPRPDEMTGFIIDLADFAPLPPQNLMDIHPDRVKYPELTRFRYYIRLLLLDSDGKCIGVPSAPVEIIYGEKPYAHKLKRIEEETKDFTPDKPYLFHPQVKIVNYHPIRLQAPQAMYHFTVIKDTEIPWGNGLLYKSGKQVDFTPYAGNKAFWEMHGDFIADPDAFVQEATQWVPDSHKEIMDYSVQIVADKLGDEIKGPLSEGLTCGLMSMGVPSILPDVDEIARLGSDYLVKFTSDFADIPPDEVQKAVDAMIEKAREYKNGASNPDAWLKPDPNFYYRPAYVELEVSNPTPNPTNHVIINIYGTVPDDNDELVFTVPYTMLPELQPGEKFTIPVFLEEYTLNRKNDKAVYDGLKRFWVHYNLHPVKFRLWTRGPLDSINPRKLQQEFFLQPCYLEYALE